MKEQTKMNYLTRQGKVIGDINTGTNFNDFISNFTHANFSILDTQLPYHSKQTTSCR